MCDQNELKRITETIVKEASQIFKDKLENVILYGSYARGDYNSESDIDVMIIVNLPTEVLSEYRSRISRISSRLSLSTEDCVTISVALKDKETFDKYKETLPFYANVIREGIKIYAA